MANAHDNTYLNECRRVLETGRKSTDRTGTGTIKLAGLNMRFDLQKGFPLLTSKFVPLGMVQKELEFFLRGETNNNWLKDRGVHIWDEFEGDDGELGPVYGAMWRDWVGAGIGSHIDQVADLMKGLREKPMSRRHVVSGWNPQLLPIEGRSHAQNVNLGYQALPPCHTLWQVHCFELTLEERQELMAKTHKTYIIADTAEKQHFVFDSHKIPRHGISLQLYQRSADMFLGVPFNIASYSLLTLMIAHSLNMQPFEFIWSGGDCHIYSDHVDQINFQLTRQSEAPQSPTVKIEADRDTELWEYTESNFVLSDYVSMGKIKGKMSV